MKIRRAFRNILTEQLRRGNIGWLFRQGLNYLLIRRSVALGTGRVYTGPTTAHLFITTRCNLSCPMCLIPRKARGMEMDTDEASSLIRDLADIGTGGISFTGGEPLLRDDIFELIGLCRMLKMPTVLVTNGTLLEEHLDELLQSPPTIINVSLDGSCPEIHEQTHVGENVFGRMISGVRCLSAAMKDEKHPQTSITISSVVRRENIDDLDNMISLSQELGAARIVLIPIHTNDETWCGVVSDPQMPPLSERLLNHPSRGFIENSDLFLNSLDRLFRGEGYPTRCTAGPTTIMLGPDRRIYPCKGYFEIDRVAFDPRESGRSLREIWYGKEYRELRRETWECNMCAFPCNREFDPLFTHEPAVPLSPERPA